MVCRHRLPQTMDARQDLLEQKRTVTPKKMKKNGNEYVLNHIIRAKWMKFFMVTECGCS